MIARIASLKPRQHQERSVTADHPEENPPAGSSAGGADAKSPGHDAASGRPGVPGARFCEAGEGWCRICEKMSDIPVLRSEDLLQGHREVLILHGNEVYRLLCTRNNKLILQK
jgi:hemin uptake protein HemP